MIYPSLEVIEAEDRSSFRCDHRWCSSFANEHPLHYHAAYELTWIIRSHGTRYVGDSVERYAPGDLVLSGPNLPHCWRDDPGETDHDSPEWIIAQFDAACFGLGFLDLVEAVGLRDLLDDASHGVTFAPDAVAEIGPELHRLHGLSGMPRLLHLIGILHRLSRYPRTRLAAPDYHTNNQIDQAMIERLNVIQRYINDNLAEDINQSDIAHRLGMSPSAFSKFFRAATGRTFMSLVKLLRINAACRMLATGDARITDIAFETGYQHTSYFGQHFQQLKGVSPSEYRRQMQELAQGGAREDFIVPG